VKTPSPTVLLGIVLPWTTSLLAVAAFLVAPPDLAASMGADHWIAWVPLASSAVVFGLLHGAVDHLEIARLARARLASPTVLAALAAYVLAAAAMISIWWFAPAAAFTAFIFLTWFHWGQGDVWFLLHRESAGEWSTLDRAVLAALRGALPMLGPLAFDPESYRRVYTATTGLFDTPTLAPSTWQWASSTALASLVILLVAHAILILRRRDAQPDGLDLGDLTVLLVLFTALPGIFAVGLYFCVWHSPRHILRLAAARAPHRLPDGAAVRKTLRDSIPLTIVSLAGGAAIGLAVVSAGFDQWVAWYLVLISGLTVPHVVVVTWRDRLEGVWRP